MKHVLPVLALCSAAWGISFPVSAAQVIGEARSASSGELRYTEYYQCSSSGEQCEVEYRDTEGELFARKQLDYTRSWHSPSLVLEHLREDSLVSVERELAEELVVDAGFDHYMRTHWDALDSGERIQFGFLPAGRESPLNMRAEREAELPCPTNRLCLRVALDNWLLGALVDPIRLQYDRDSKRLMRYLGISNLRDGEGKQQEVRIDYRYVAGTGESEERS